MEATTKESMRRPPASSSAPVFDLDGTQDGTGGGGQWSLTASGTPSQPAPAGLAGESCGLWSLWLVVACLSFPTLVFVSGVYRPPLALVSGVAGGSTTSLQHQDQESVVHASEAPAGNVPGHGFVSGSGWSWAGRQPVNSKHRPKSGAGHSWGQRCCSNPQPEPESVYLRSFLFTFPSGRLLSHRWLQSSGTPTPRASPSNSKVTELHSVLAPSPSPNSGKKLPLAALRNATAPAPSQAPVAGGGSSSVAQLHKMSTQASLSPSSDVSVHDDKLLGGLLAAGFNEGSCQSRYESYAYRKASPHKPSPYLLRRLREYEALHRRCGPLTRSYKRSLRQLKHGGGGGTPGGSCKYVAWNPENGLGNRMLSIASAFLYALLSNRVLLVDGSTDLAGLFCEPFPGSTWLLSHDFPLRHLPFNQKYSESYGNLLRANRIGTNRGSAPAFVYAHLSSDYDDHDKRFYCEANQLHLEMIGWVMLRSDQYFVPALFLNPAFERELVRMFPEKEEVFHHLGRYLFHPSNEVWGLVTGYYRDHLAKARERLGIQIRVFDNKLRPFHLILRQILNCTLSEKLLPEVDLRRRVTPPSSTGEPSKTVLLASLHSVFYDQMKEMYSENPAVGGEVISFHQPSHEEEQRTGMAVHDGKALAEMYLLSLADALVTSSWSTFGYVAQGLGGMTPWVLSGPVHASVPKPACVRDLSPEPCFHFPPDYDCKARRHAEMANLLPYTRHCKDFRRGIKLVDVR